MYGCCVCVVQALKLTTAPVFLHIPPRGQPRWKTASAPTQGVGSGAMGSILTGPDVFDIQHQGFSAEVLAKWVSERSDVQASFLYYSIYLSPSPRLKPGS